MTNYIRRRRVSAPIRSRTTEFWNVANQSDSEMVAAMANKGRGGPRSARSHWRKTRRPNLRLHRQLIDVDALEGSLYLKANAPRPDAKALRSAFFRCLLLPLFPRYWAKEYSFRRWLALSVLYLCQLFVTWIYLSRESSTLRGIMSTDIFFPPVMLLVCAYGYGRAKGIHEEAVQSQSSRAYLHDLRLNGLPMPRGSLSSPDNSEEEEDMMMRQMMDGGDGDSEEEEEEEEEEGEEEEDDDDDDDEEEDELDRVSARRSGQRSPLSQVAIKDINQAIQSHFGRDRVSEKREEEDFEEEEDDDEEEEVMQRLSLEAQHRQRQTEREGQKERETEREGRRPQERREEKGTTATRGIVRVGVSERIDFDNIGLDNDFEDEEESSAAIIRCTEPLEPAEEATEHGEQQQPQQYRDEDGDGDGDDFAALGAPVAHLETTTDDVVAYSEAPESLSLPLTVDLGSEHLPIVREDTPLLPLAPAPPKTECPSEDAGEASSHGGEGPRRPPPLDLFETATRYRSSSDNGRRRPSATAVAGGGGVGRVGGGGGGRVKRVGGGRGVGGGTRAERSNSVNRERRVRQGNSSTSGPETRTRARPRPQRLSVSSTQLKKSLESSSDNQYWITVWLWTKMGDPYKMPYTVGQLRRMIVEKAEKCKLRLSYASLLPWMAAAVSVLPFFFRLLFSFLESEQEWQLPQLQTAIELAFCSPPGGSSLAGYNSSEGNNNNTQLANLSAIAVAIGQALSASPSSSLSSASSSPSLSLSASIAASALQSTHANNLTASDGPSLSALYANLTSNACGGWGFRWMGDLVAVSYNFLVTGGAEALAVAAVSAFSSFVLSLGCLRRLGEVEICYQRRYIYAKYFSALTSSRRARREGLPHFRLKSVVNIKAWLSLRSVRNLHRRDEHQRAADGLVSSTFILTLLLVASVIAQLAYSERTEGHDLFPTHINIRISLWCFLLSFFVLRYMMLGSRVNRRYKNVALLITEQMNIYLRLHLCRDPQKKDRLKMCNNVLDLAVKILKESEKPNKISGVTMNPFLYNVARVVVLSAFSAVVSDLLGFKLKLWKLI